MSQIDGLGASMQLIRAGRSPARSLRLVLAFGLLVAGLIVACSRTIEERTAVHVLHADAQVNPILARYIDRGIDEAERTEARAVIIQLDTPGGLVTSMEDIVQRIQSSAVPVIVYVSPAGGKAASAGTFITMAGHVAAMAPQTRIGAAHPVAAGGGDIEGTLGEKVENDAAAYARAIAQERGRNEEWAEDAVRDSVSASAQEAVELNVVDFIAEDIDHLLAQSDGRTVRLASGEVTLAGLVDAPRVDNKMTLFERFLMLISDPNIAFLLLTLGGLGLIIELYQPGIGLPGITGTIALILGLLSVGTLPVNWAGVALILLAFALFAAEAFAPGFGVFGVGGAISLMLGGLIMTSSSDPEFQVSRWLVVAVGVICGIFVLMVVNAIIRSRRPSRAIGTAALVGQLATARSNLSPNGFVWLRGERWKAISDDDTPIHEGQRVEIIGSRGLTLRVRPRPDLAKSSDPGANAPAHTTPPGHPEPQPHDAAGAPAHPSHPAADPGTVPGA